jgi:DNA-3-methyladenine glycosylase
MPKRFSESGKAMGTRSLIDMPDRKRLDRDFYTRDVLEVAPGLISKILAVRLPDDSVRKFPITETEAYRGREDEACHASKGRTDRTEIMYHEGGRLYVYFVYGMHWMLNVVTGPEDDPQATLIRGIEGFNGPGKVTRSIGIDRSFYGEDLVLSERIWIEDSGIAPVINTGPRVGINYAGEYWKTRPWRYYVLP